ncbi:MAG: hypothetical protein E6Q83_00920 [Thiothrix sp.]|nr:MAG: hypothetical protein E6Q83_00920 [Thiothrix sp.]
MVSKESIQLELERILASELFVGKKQAGKFLQYIVNETLEGRGERITQYGIAIEALGKPLDYCPTESPAVRVEAGRVRKLLEEYYADEKLSSQHACQITLPLGGYTPVFKPVDSARVQWRRLGGKRVQSSGPKIYIACQNPASIRDDRLRSVMYKIRSSMPVMLGKLGTVQIALADPGFAFSYADHALEYAWRQHQAEFLLYSEAVLQGDTPKLRYVLIHTLSREVVWSAEFGLASTESEQLLEEMYVRLVTEVFSLYQGTALSFWSHYWYQQPSMPEAYQVLAAHVRFLQDEVSESSFQAFWQVCQKRTRQYHDDALAHLHYAVACLYAHMLKTEPVEILDELWQRQALAALELNPGNALAHAIFAVNCYARGENELARVEIEIARKSNPFDSGCERLIATGLCALRAWDKGFRLLKADPLVEFSYPDPLRTVPCLYYFRRGRYINHASTDAGFNDLGGWEQFGRFVNACRAGDCKACTYSISKVVDRLQPDIGVGLHSYLWQDKANQQDLTESMT